MSIYFDLSEGGLSNRIKWIVSGMRISDFLKTDLYVYWGNNGYVQKGVVNNNGEFSLRGSVIDFFSSNLAKPARIEIFQDRIESLRLFNPDTQLTIKKVNKLSTLPVFEYPLDKKSISEFVENWRNAFSNSYENDSEIFRKLNQSKPSNGAEIYLPLFYGKKVTLLSFLNKFSKLLL